MDKGLTWGWAARAYLRRNRMPALLFGVLLILLFVVYGLYGLPWGPAVYTALLLCLCAAILGGLGLRGYCKKLRRVQTLQRQVSSGLGEFPPPDDLLEAEYQELIRLLERQCRAVEDAAAQNASKAARYYALWSHQIKTPLAAIRLLLREEPVKRDSLLQETFKTEQYVDMALQYQRLSGGPHDLVLKECRMDALVKQAAKQVSTLFIYKRVRFSLGELSLRAVTDEKWMVFVLEQLLTNAVKYTPEGGSVSVYERLEPAPRLVVADTGIGIRPEDLPRVFDWGFTGSNGRLERHSTGIGLSLCKQVLDLLGHSIRLESQVGQGTRAVLDLSQEPFDIE